MEFYDAYHFLATHRIFDGHFSECLDIEVVKVDPLTSRIEDDSSLNTKTKVWLECGPWEYSPLVNGYAASHDPGLDCGGDSFEEAICVLASLVKENYT